MTTDARPAVAAGVLFFDQAGRILMVVPSYKDYLDIPGGLVEPRETPLAAARREVREEIGIEPPVGRLLVVDCAPTARDGAQLVFIFDGGELSEADRRLIQVDGEEITAYEFHPVEDLARLTIPIFVRRITRAADARSRHTTDYLESGYLALRR